MLQLFSFLARRSMKKILGKHSPEIYAPYFGEKVRRQETVKARNNSAWGETSPYSSDLGAGVGAGPSFPEAHPNESYSEEKVGRQETIPVHSSSASGETTPHSSHTGPGFPVAHQNGY